MTDGDMVIHLHDLARATGNNKLREIADRLAELQKESNGVQHKTFDY